MNWTCSSTFCFFSLGPCRGVKSSNIIQFQSQSQLQSQSQRCLYHTLSMFSQIKDIKHIEWGFHSVAWVLGVLRVENTIPLVCLSSMQSSNPNLVCMLLA